MGRCKEIQAIFLTPRLSTALLPLLRTYNWFQLQDDRIAAFQLKHSPGHYNHASNDVFRIVRSDTEPLTGKADGHCPHHKGLAQDDYHSWKQVYSSK